MAGAKARKRRRIASNTLPGASQQLKSVSQTAPVRSRLIAILLASCHSVTSSV